MKRSSHGGFTAAALTLSLATPAAAQILWTGAAADGGNWNNAANWTPNTVPNSATADAVFGATGVGSLNILLSVQTRSLTFANPTGAYGIAAPAGVNLSGVTAVTVNPEVTGKQTINLTSAGNANLLVPGGSNLTLTNNAFPTAFNDPSLAIGPGTILDESGPSPSALVVTGTGTTEISGTIRLTGLTKSGPGTLVLSGDGVGFSGGSTLAGGTVVLDYRPAASFKLPSGTTNFAGGDLLLLAHPTSAFTEVTGIVNNLQAGHTGIRFDAGAGTAGVLLNLNTLTRQPVGTLDVTPATNSNLRLLNALSNGIVGGWATVNEGQDWATKDASNSVVPLTTYAPGFGAGLNTRITGNTTTAFATSNSLRIDSGATLTLSSTLTLQSGGLLAPSGTTTITGGTLFAGAGELIVHAGGNTIINSTLSAAGGLTKTGPGTLTLGGNTADLGTPGNRAIHVNRGSLLVTNPLTLQSITAINFNDNRAESGLQAFGFEVGDGVDVTVPAAIRLSAGAPPAGFGNVFVNNSPNSTATLSGVISSAPGLNTSLAFINNAPDVPSRIHLTGNNTFTGEVGLGTMTLGIASNASLGNPSNALVLAAGSLTQGGLEFLNGGIDVSRSIRLISPTRIISNGVDVNTLSGPISDVGTLVKDGAGTLVLSGTNTFTGGVWVNAGTLRVGAAANLGASGDVILGDATLASTGTFVLPNTRTARLGRAAVDVAAGQTVTLNGPVIDVSAAAPGSLTKTGPGTLVLGNLNPTNTYGGGTTVQQGALRVPVDSSLGTVAAPVSIGPLGALTYTGTTSTGRTFTINGGTLAVGSGATLTFANANVGGGFLTGPGSFNTAVGGSTLFSGGDFTTSANVTLRGSDVVNNYDAGGTLTTNVGTTVTMSRVTNGPGGRVTVNGAVNADDFVSTGQLTVNNGASFNHSLAPLFLGGGSTTFVGSPSTPGGTINLGGQPLQLRGGLLVNNGTVTNGATVVDFGGLAKGAGFYQSVSTVNGGRFSPGNSPGRATVGTFFMSPGGAYDFEINNATGTAGPVGVAGLSGWDLTLVGNTLDLTATPAQPFTVNLLTLLNPSPPDVAGAMANFNSGQAYSWLAFDVNPGGQILNWDPARIQLNSTGVVNPLAGNFSVHRSGLQVFVDYVPSTATLYWDTNGSAAAGAGGAAPAGNWDGLAANFNSDPAGGAGALTAATGSSHRVVFAAGADGGGTYAVALTGIRPAATVEIARGNVTFDGGTLAAGAFDVAAGATGTVNSAVAGGPAGSVVKSGPGTLTLNALNTYAGGTTVQAGTLRVKRLHQNSPVNITAGKLQVMESTPTLPAHPSGDDAFVSRPSALTIANNGAPLGARVYNGQLDLTNNDLIIDYSGASPIAEIEDMIRAGYNGGDWLGIGITSSSANANRNFALGAADNARLTIKYGAARPFSGQTVDDTTILVKFTHRIDLDLDGVVTSNDATIFNSNYSEGAPAYWSIGDVDYDRVFTTNDATLFNSFYSEALASVPEPAALGVLTLTAAGLLARRRRQRALRPTAPHGRAAV